MDQSIRTALLCAAARGVPHDILDRAEAAVVELEGRAMVAQLQTGQARSIFRILDRFLMTCANRVPVIAISRVGPSVRAHLVGSPSLPVSGADIADALAKLCMVLDSEMTKENN